MKHVRIGGLVVVLLVACGVLIVSLMDGDRARRPPSPPTDRPAGAMTPISAAQSNRETPLKSPAPGTNGVAAPPASGAKRRPSLPTEVLAGVLVDSFGDPLPALHVRIVQVGAGHNRSGATTDADGRFFCGGLMPGRYDLTIRNGQTLAGYNGFLEVRASPDRWFGSFLSPREDPHNRNAPFVLARFHGVEAGTEALRLVVAPETAVRFRVLEAGTGEPVAGAVAEVDWGDGRAGTVASVGGRFTVVCRDLFRFGVRVRVEGGDLAPSPRRVHEVARGENGEEIVVTLGPGQTVSGHTRWKGPEPRPRITATARDPVTAAPITSTVVRNDGSYRLERLPRGGLIEIVLSGANVATRAMRYRCGAEPPPTIDLRRGCRVLMRVEARSSRRLTVFLRNAKSSLVHFERHRLRPLGPRARGTRFLRAHWWVEPGEWVVCIADEHGTVLMRANCRAREGTITRVPMTLDPGGR